MRSCVVLLLCLIYSTSFSSGTFGMLTTQAGNTSTCNSNQFTCLNRDCIPMVWRCDQADDCIDGTDEKNCPQCTEDQFMCKNGECIDASAKCNKHKNCSDGSDEHDCTICGPSFFSCKTTGKCIYATWQCDGLDDCGDQSDEIDCERNSTQPGTHMKLASHLSAQMVCGIVAAIFVCVLLFALSLLVWRRLKCNPYGHVSNDIGLVAMPGPVLNGHAPSSSPPSESHASVRMSVVGSGNSGQSGVAVLQSTKLFHSASPPHNLHGDANDYKLLTVL